MSGAARGTTRALELRSPLARATAGALAVVVANALALALSFLVGGDELVDVGRPIRAVLGLLQLVYAIPIAGIVWWRSGWAAAAGAAAVALATLAASLYALRA